MSRVSPGSLGGPGTPGSPPVGGSSGGHEVQKDPGVRQKYVFKCVSWLHPFIYGTKRCFQVFRDYDFPMLMF